MNTTFMHKVDKRTAEDFRLHAAQAPQLKGLIGEITKAADFEMLLPADSRHSFV